MATALSSHNGSRLWGLSHGVKSPDWHGIRTVPATAQDCGNKENSVISIQPPLVLEQAAHLGHFRSLLDQGRPAFLPEQLTHLYLKLDFQHQYENARTAQDARLFLRSVARAAMAAHGLAERYRGIVQEIQGSMIHIVVPTSPDGGLGLAAELHHALDQVFDDKGSRVTAWRMALDSGRTLVVANRDVHGDDSYVALGQAANRPAKYLFSQLALAEDDRQLQKFCAAIRNTRGGWDHTDLNQVAVPLLETKEIAGQARRDEPLLYYSVAIRSPRRVTAHAAPISPHGDSRSPEPDTPHTYFGWVMRADLDGFSARVDQCMNNEAQLKGLAQQFHSIMAAATDFVNNHSTVLAQVPWAGDNLTVAAVFSTKQEYDSAIGTKLVELAHDFEKEMSAAAVASEFGGWAYGVAGGQVHGNSHGNVYIAGIGIGARRFLVGVGEGFGRSAKAFGDIDPKPSEIVLYDPDWQELEVEYKGKFGPATTCRGNISTLFKITSMENIRAIRARKAAATVTTPVTFSDSSREVASRHYFYE